MSASTEIRRIRGRIAEEQITHIALARQIQITPSKFSRILHGHQDVPDDFVERTEAAIDIVVRARAEAERAYRQGLASGGL